MTLSDLAVDHPYYCNDNNWCDREAAQDYDTWQDFLAEWKDADLDMNLLFRWDITEDKDDNEKGLGTFSMQLCFIQQRRGRYVPIQIARIAETNVPSIFEYLGKYWTHLQLLWSPLSKR